MLILWNLSEDRKNYELSQTWTQKSTKKTVKTTSKVRPNYKQGGKKKLKEIKYLLKGGSFTKMTYTGVNEFLCFICMTFRVF